MSSEQEPRKDTRWARIKSTDTSVLMHPCRICGLANAPFGVNVCLMKGQLGDWYCAEHLPAEHRTTTKRKPE